MPKIYANEEDRMNARKITYLNNYYNNSEVKNIQRLINYHKKCLKNPNLSEDKIAKHNLKIFENQQKLNAIKQNK